MLVTDDIYILLLWANGGIHTHGEALTSLSQNKVLMSDYYIKIVL